MCSDQDIKVTCHAIDSRVVVVWCHWPKFPAGMHKPWASGCLGTKFFTMAHHTFSTITAVFPLCTRTCISSWAPCRKHNVTVMFTGHSRIVGPPFTTSLMSLFWHVEFGGSCYSFGKMWAPDTSISAWATAVVCCVIIMWFTTMFSVPLMSIINTQHVSQA